MKKTITNLVLSCLSMSVFCQSPIILTQSNFPAPTIGVPLEDVTSQVTTAPATGSNQTWDCSTLTTGISASNNFVTVSNNPYIPGAQFMLATYFKNITPQLGFYYDQYYAISSAGAYVVGIHVPAQAFGIGALTGRAADSLYVLDTFINYSTPTVRPVMTFPATDGSVWHTTNLRHMINLQLTDSAYHLNRFSIQQVFYFNRVDSVAGWGTLKLPAQAGFNNNVPVLQEMLQQYYIDSFFVGGALAPRTLTSAFGITQGQNTGAAYRMLFYRDGEFNYQMLFNFTDNTFSTPNAVLINDHLPFYTGINDLHNDRSSAVYPNPITGSHFTIRMSSQAQASTITISDLSGREIQTMTPSIYGNSLKVEMSKPLSEGMYIYTIKDAAGNTLNTGKITADK